ncbi:MAG: YicC/YloC family endoribonuclease [Candidatus Omnitrophota bacterium]|nr:YicC/YloC family endoribonuclease [Candidatus Omnitrophota bacterium]
MIRSMTGFGRGEAKFKNGKITIEIKTINHKFFDATLKLPNNISTFEDAIKDILLRRLSRGKINLNLIYDGTILKDDRIKINRKTAKRYYEELASLKKYLGLKDDIAMKDLAALPGVLTYEPFEENLAGFWPKIKEALESALGRLVADRGKEGALLCRDLARRAKKIGTMLSVIKSRSYLNIEEYKKKFADRIKDLTSGRDIDMGRLEIEVAIFAKSSDISEEITRLDNHLSNLNKTLSGGGEAGKKIDFIAQELHREINTIGSKASDFKISKNAIEIKSEIEKIREQAKNLE